HAGAFAQFAARAEISLRRNISLLSGFPTPGNCFRVALLDTATQGVATRKLPLASRKTARRAFAKPLGTGRGILCNADSIQVRQTEFLVRVADDWGFGNTFRIDHPAKTFYGFRFVLRDSSTFQIHLAESIIGGNESQIDRLPEEANG